MEGITGDEEKRDQARALTEALRNVTAENQQRSGLEQATKALRFVYVLGGVICAMLLAAYALGVQVQTLKNSIEKHDEKINEFNQLKRTRDEQVSKFDGYHAAYELAEQNVTNSIKSLQDATAELRRKVDAMEPVLTYLDVLRKMGISFKEDYAIQHQGFPPPHEPTSETTTPKRP